jgi:ligand-binding sensor domain-containing protein
VITHQWYFYDMKLLVAGIVLIQLIIGLPVSNLVAQNEQYHFRHFSREQGLSQVAGQSLSQDTLGFLWIGTQDGLNRFDGYRFKVFRNDRDNKNTLSSNFVWCTLHDKAGTLWVGTRRGLNRFDAEHESFVSYVNNPLDSSSIPSDVVLSLFQDREKRYWVGTAKGLCLFDPRSGKFVQLRNKSGPNTIDVRCVYQDNRGRILAGTRMGVVEIDPVSLTFALLKTGLSDEPALKGMIFRILHDSRNRLWACTYRSGLLMIDEKENVHTFYNDPANPTALSSDDVRTICEDSKGNIWVGTANGLNRYLEASKNFLQIRKVPGDQTSLSDNSIESLFEDNSGLLWIGTRNGGLNLLDPKTLSFHHYKKTEEKSLLSDKPIRAMHEDGRHTGKIWIGFEGGGVGLFDRTTGDVQRFVHEKTSNSLSNDFVWHITEDADYNLWIATDNGLDILNPERTEFRNLQLSQVDLNANLVNCTFRTRDNNLWFGTWAGLFMYDVKTHSLTQYKNKTDDPSSLSQNTVLCMYEDDAGQLWVGTNGGGINIFDRAKKTFRALKNIRGNSSSLSNNDVQCIFEDSKKRIWVGTNGGLNRYNADTENFKVYLKKDGLSNDFVFGILEDASGALWFSTNEGLNKIDPETETIARYNSWDGLQSDEFYTGAYVKDSQGYMYFGGANGFNAFHPDSIKPNPLPPKVLLTDFLLFNKSRPMEKSITHQKEINLQYTDYIFGFEFSALNFRQPEKNRFQYMLKGFDKDWINSTESGRLATYTNVPPGSYTFLVRASNNDGLWNPTPAYVRVVITPPWWKTWWAIALQVIAGLSLAWAAVNYRIRQIKMKVSSEKQMWQLEMKALKAQMNPHFVFNAMNSAQSLITDNHAEEALKYISRFAKLLRMVLENSEKTRISLSEELASLELYLKLESLRLDYSVQYRFEIEEGIQADEKMVPPLFLQPFVENALWHGLSTKQGTRILTIGVHTENDCLICTVTDNGIGRKRAREIQKQTSRDYVSKGLSITQRRLEIFNPDGINPVTIEDLYSSDGKPQGTQVTIRVFQALEYVK